MFYWMKKCFKMKIVLIILSLLVSFSFEIAAQVVVKGDDCAIKGKEFYYFLQTDANDSASYQISIVGGHFDSSNIHMLSISKSTLIKVTWDSIGVGLIKVLSNSDTVLKLIFVAENLDPGYVLDNDIQQTIQKDKTTYLFHCSEAKGAHCDPVFTYQWQQSFDGVVWTNIQNGQGQDLLFDTRAVNSTIYLRRNALEVKSKTFGTSNIAMLIRITE